MESMMKERFSNILAWGSFIPFAIMLSIGMYAVFVDKQSVGRLLEFAEFNIPVVVYVFCATLNYLMVGRFRFLPWK
jgi:hypothetical protein